MSYETGPTANGWRDVITETLSAKMPEATGMAILKGVAEELVEVTEAFVRDGECDLDGLGSEYGDLIGCLLYFAGYAAVDVDKALDAYLAKITRADFVYVGGGRYRRVKP